MSEYLAPFEAMLASLFPPARVREIGAGGDWSTGRAEIERSGFLDSLADEAAGGPGLSVADVVPLWRALGAYAAPTVIGEAMIERGRGDAGPARAIMLAAAISGAADRVLEMSVDYANQRVQFGKPIGRQQAVQHQLATMAEEVVAVRLAVDLAGASGWPTPERAALATRVAAENAATIANTAHAVHGAIGISEEYDLQLYTSRLHAWRLELGGETLAARSLGRAVLKANGSTLDWMRASLF